MADLNYYGSFLLPGGVARNTNFRAHRIHDRDGASLPSLFMTDILSHPK